MGIGGIPRGDIPPGGSPGSIPRGIPWGDPPWDPPGDPPPGGLPGGSPGGIPPGTPQGITPERKTRLYKRRDWEHPSGYAPWQLRQQVKKSDARTVAIEGDACQ